MKRALVAACLCAALVGGIALNARERPQTVVAAGATISLDDLRREGIQQRAAEAQFAADQAERDAAGAAYRAQLDAQEAVSRVPVQRAARSAPNPRPRIAAAQPVQVGGDIWGALARCESGGNPRAVGGGGKFFGAFQFTLSTWHAMGHPGNPVDYDYATQLAAAQRLVARAGWGQFPACSRRLGLR